MTTKLPQPTCERIFGRVSPEPMSGCWLYLGPLNRNGYGLISIHNRTRLAHRASYEVFVGRIPVGLTLDHSCRVRSCLNPRHLTPMLNRDNVLRGTGPSAQAAKVTHCPQGHAYSIHGKTDARGWRVCRPCHAAIPRKSRRRS